jgi:hypothetical protein
MGATGKPLERGAWFGVLWSSSDVADHAEICRLAFTRKLLLFSREVTLHRVWLQRGASAAGRTARP